MSENYKTEKIGVTALCRISAKGGEGVYLYIPKNFAAAYSIVGADYAEVVFKKVFYKIADGPAVASKVVDMRSRSKKEEKKAKAKADSKGDADGEEAEAKEQNDFGKGEIP
jgi:hypothetical protein